MMSLAKAAAFVAAACSSVSFAQLTALDNQTLPVSLYMTRPQAHAPFLNITQASNFTQGYIFMGPYQHPGAGAYIYDKFGNLVWDGFGVVGSANAHDFKVCQYQGSPHLCISQMNQQSGYGVGQGLIIDSNYQVVATVQTGNDAMPSDMHEFQLLDNGNGGSTAILTSYRVVVYDLTHWNITNGQGWLSEGMFQEIDVETGDVLFEWYSTNHVDPTATVIPINGTDISGDGLTPSTAFDYFHINSVDKSNFSGDYLVSGRHTSTIYYVNATDQNIIWQMSFLGQSDFELSNFNFSFQHDVRIQAENSSGMTLSMFDNAGNCFAQTSPTSSGRVIQINYDTKVATQISQTFPPDHLLSCSQGNTQIFEDGGVFHGWGSNPWISEHDSNGDIVLAGVWASPDTAMSYRSFSAPWESTPANTIPVVYSYALNVNNATNQIHVSWNGATTVAHWRFYGAQAIGDAFNPIGATLHAGFETIWTAPRFYQWVMVEALGPNGASLRNSSYTPTWVPSASLATSCDAAGCPAVFAYT